MLDIYIIANAALGPHMSGGDRIFIECARKWAASGHNITIYVWEEGLDMCKRNELEGVNYVVWPAGRYRKFGFAVSYFMRAIIGMWNVLKMSTQTSNGNILIYSSSDFWPDSLPAFVMSLKFPRAKWIAGFYLFAPGPWGKDSPYKGKRWLIGFFYWLTQIPIYVLVKKIADMVFVTSEPDVKKFITPKRNSDKIAVIRGGVDIGPSKDYLNSNNVIPFEKKTYDVCFVGRFHYQKGIVELIDIFKLICKDRPGTKLAVIGAGPLEKEMQGKIREYGMQDNIDLLGFRDGEAKYEIFKQSRIIAHPATYDSGGMAACEAMAWGIPGVSFDLEALKTYYPKGMIKTVCYDYAQFAANVIKLLEDKELYGKTSEDAISWAREWDWGKRADEILNDIKKGLGNG